MSLMPAQQKAVAARGNVLVMAGAGTGKTSTLVARCLDCLGGSDPTSLDELLVVTFTEGASAEARERIRAAPGRRELPFTARFTPAELDGSIHGTDRRSDFGNGLQDEFAEVQGVADLVVLQRDAIWLLDFKTDELTAGEVAVKAIF